jgi:hypothetical protein
VVINNQQAWGAATAAVARRAVGGPAPLVVREIFAAPEQEAVMVILVIFDWFLALQLGSLLYNRLAQ